MNDELRGKGIRTYRVGAGLLRLAGLAVLACLGWVTPVAAEEVDAEIAHRPVETALSGVRIELSASVQDAAGVDLARVYFKAQREANYLFVPMRVAGEGGYSAVLPAPSAGVGAVEYQILVRNLGGVVYKTQIYSVDIEDGEAAVVEDNESIEVFTELAEAPDVVRGFTDNIALDTVESAAKYGVVMGLTGEAGAGTAAGSVGATSGGTVTATGSATATATSGATATATGSAGAASGATAAAGAATAGAAVSTTVVAAAATAAAVGGAVAVASDDKNEAPEFPSRGPLDLDVGEGTTGTFGDPVTAVDPDDDVLTYSLSGADAGSFEIDANNGQLRVGASTTLDYETRTGYAFAVVAADPAGEKARRTVNITVTNLAPAFAESGDLSLSVLENRPGDISGGLASASDPGGGEVTYSLSGAEAASFSIDGSGQLSVLSPGLDFEEKASYAFAVVAADPAGEKARRNVVVTVLDEDENQAPAFADASPLALLIAEGSTGAFGDPVTAADPDGDALAYSLSGADAASFSIDGSGQLSVLSPGLDFEGKADYAFAVVAADPAGEKARRTVNITVTNLAPAFAESGDLSLSVLENRPGDISDGLASASDPGGGEVTYSLSGAEAASFSIDGSGQLSVLSPGLDFEEQASYAFAVVAADPAGKEARLNVMVTVLDEDENRAPAFADASPLALLVAEGSTGAFGDPVTAVDPDDDVLTYSLSGADAGAFEIDGSSGQLRVGASTTLDYETRTGYAFEVVASDGDLTARRTVNITVTNRAPEFAESGDLSLSVLENRPGNISDGVASASDPGGGEVTYSLDGADAASFSIDGSGQLSVLSPGLDFEEKASYAFVVVAADPAGEKARLNVVVTVLDEDENRAPAFADASPLALPVAEGFTGAFGDPVTAVDPDDDVLTYSLSGADEASFSIDGSGQLSVLSPGLDFEGKADYAFAVVAADPAGEKASRTVNITVTNLAPAFAESDDLSLSVLENRPGDISDGLASASDPGGGEVTYSLDGAEAASFSIDGSGQLSVLSPGLDFEEQASYAFAVVAADPAGEKARLNVVVTVLDEDENRAPAFANGDLLVLPVAEGSTGALGEPVTAVDPDGHLLTYRLSGADAGSFEIDADSGQLRVGASTVLNYEARTDYNFEVVASDGELEATRAVSVTVTNLAPAFAESGDLSLSVLENSPGDISGGLASASDPGGGEVTYSLDGAEAASFSIDGSGQLSVLSPGLDFEEQASYAFAVVAADPAGEEARRNVVVTVEPDANSGLANDWRALVALYEATDGANWSENANWSNVDTMPTTGELDAWYGVTVSNGRVTGLSLPENQLTGPVPPELGKLTSLEWLWLHNNELTGSVPPELGKLSRLEGLSLSRNELTGSVPPELGKLSSLRELYLYGNQLTGSVPPELGKLSSLRELYLYGNQLTGSVPPELGKLTSLEVLYLQDNQLTDALPSSLTKLNSLSSFSWDGQKVDESNVPPLCAPTDEAFQAWLKGVENARGPNCGGLEQDWRALVALYEATDGANWINNANWSNVDTMPTAEELGSWHGVTVGTTESGMRVTSLVLNNNNLHGTIPPWSEQLTKLEELYLVDNLLSGKIPPELGQLSSLKYLGLSLNKLSDEIPPELGELTKLEHLSLAHNQLVGTLPAALTNLGEMSSFYWGYQNVDSRTPLCAPTDDAFQKWLANITDTSGPNCSADSAASSVAGPKVMNLAIVSSPGPDGVYAAGEAIEAAVRFDRPVTVSGMPQLRLGVGNALAAAVHALPDGRETETLTFRYTVAQGDHDADGVSVGAGALLLNGGAIVGADGAAAAVSLGAHAIRNAAEHIVDARVREAEKAILEDALAAQGRAHLASVTDVIGERFRAGPAAPFSLRDRLRLGSGLPAGAPGADALAMNDLGAFSMGPGARSSQMPVLSGGALPLVPGREAWPSGMADTASLGGRGGFSLGSLFGNDFAIPLSADQEEPSGAGWTLWGAHDLQSFRAATDNGSYDGDLRSLYLGIDGRIGDSWLAGVALSRSRGEIDYGFEVDALQGEGALRTRLSSIYPYLHGELASGMEVWGIAGFGSGKATLRREEVDAVERSDLGLGLGSMGLRQGLREFGSLKLSLLADAGLARLWTGGGSDTLDALSATVGRMRVGVEGEHDLTLAGGALQPFWRVSGRYDGGDGVTGGGLELATGVRYRSERLEAQVQGRWLTMHSASSQEEFGASASLRINARANGLGFAASLSPRWGAAEGSGAIWREDLLRDSHRLPTQRANPWSMDGRLEYGFALPRMAGVLKPFGETRLAGESSARQRFGLRFDRSVNDWSMLGVELGLGRVGRPTGGTDHAIDLTVDAWF